MFKRFSNTWLTLVINYPKWILLFIALILLAAIAGLPRFKLDASADSLTLENDTALSYFRDVSKKYSSGDMLIVTFTPKQDLFSDEALQVMARLQADLEAVEGVNSVNSILNVPLLYSPKRSLREVSQETLTLLSPGVDRDQAREEFLNSPIYREMILSPDGNTTAMQLNIGVDRTYINLVQERDALREKRAQEQLTTEEQARLETGGLGARGDRVVDDVLVPPGGEAVPHRDRGAVVEGEDHQHQDRDPEEEVDEERVEPERHAASSPHAEVAAQPRPVQFATSAPALASGRPRSASAVCGCGLAAHVCLS